MNADEIKLDVINRIAKLKDLYIIEEIKKLLDFELDEKAYQLNEAQKSRLTEAKTDKVLTEDEANRQIEEWLNEK